MSLRQVNDSALCKQALRFILTKKGEKRENSVISKLRRAFVSATEFVISVLLKSAYLPQCLHFS